ncbi:hypothetical protein BDR05DRAFT_831788, partial [Suillus weaverae]
ILSIACNNASNNTILVDNLETMLLEFGRAAAHTRCFLHIVNLIAKSLIQEFD